MSYPVITINKAKLEHNARRLADLCSKQGMRLVGVAKGVCAHPAVVEAMLAGGAAAIGDSRIDNLKRLRRHGYKGETILLRAPGPSQCQEAVMYADASLNSETSIVRLLGEAAIRAGKVHNVILMVDLGDLREGVMPEQAADAAAEFDRIPGIRLLGIGTNMACYGGVIPTREKMELLLQVKDQVEQRIGRPLERVSGGTSANIQLVLDGEMPHGITELRVGEGILLGTEAVERRPIPGCVRDAFLIKAEVIEVKTKPSKPMGKIGQDAFGNVPVFEDRGLRRRAIVSIGQQDIDLSSLFPRDKGVEILGASSDHLICDVEEAERPVNVGDILEFGLAYGTLLKAFTSPFVTKEVLEGCQIA